VWWADRRVQPDLLAAHALLETRRQQQLAQVLLGRIHGLGAVAGLFRRLPGGDVVAGVEVVTPRVEALRASVRRRYLWQKPLRNVCN